MKKEALRNLLSVASLVLPIIMMSLYLTALEIKQMKSTVPVNQLFNLSGSISEGKIMLVLFIFIWIVCIWSIPVRPAFRIMATLIYAPRFATGVWEESSEGAGELK